MGSESRFATAGPRDDFKKLIDLKENVVLPSLVGGVSAARPWGLFRAQKVVTYFIHVGGRCSPLITKGATMIPQPRNAAQDALDAVYALMEYVGGRCPTLYDLDMEEKFHEVLESLENLVQMAPTSRYHRSRLADCCRSRNYLVAQVSALLVFANRIAELTERENIEIVRQPLADLRRELERRYERFIKDARSRCTAESG